MSQLCRARLGEHPAANPPSESNAQLLGNIVKMMIALLNLAAAVPISHARWVQSITELPAVRPHCIDTAMPNPNGFELFRDVGHAQIDALHS